MTLRERFGSLFKARVTTPEYGPTRPIAWLPTKRGNILVTHEKALEFGTCFACARAISEDIAKLPWNVFAKSGNTRTKLDNSALSRLINVRPNPQMGSFTFRETLVMHALIWGNGYAEIERNIQGQPLALWIIAPERVTPMTEGNRVVYEIYNRGGQRSYIPQEDMFHLHGVGYDGLTGYSMVGLAAQSLGFGIAAEEHGAGFYGNNTTPGMALKTDHELSEEGFKRLQEQLAEKKGSARAYEGMILEQGLDFARPNMSQVDAQYVETRRLIIEEICRWWRVPPHKVGELDRAHFDNVEALDIAYVTDTLMPWAKRLEEEADWKLIGPRSMASYTKIALQALMRGDSAARASFYKEMFNMGAFSPNMILAMEDIDPIGPEGDEHYIQSAMTTLKNVMNAPLETAPSPEDTAMEATKRTVARLIAPTIKRAETAKNRYGRTEFAAWMDDQNAHAQMRVEAGIKDLQPLATAAFGNEIDIDIATDAYFTAERQALFSLHSGQEPDYDAVVDAVYEAIQ